MLVPSHSGGIHRVEKVISRVGKLFAATSFVSAAAALA